MLVYYLAVIIDIMHLLAAVLHHFLIFDAMSIEKSIHVRRQNISLASVHLGRTVEMAIFLPATSGDQGGVSLLLINDGQDLDRVGLEGMLDELYERDLIHPLICVGIHAGADRKMEYGTAGQPDYLGRGAKAEPYTRFVFEELMPLIRRRLGIPVFREKAFAGFSLGALSAMDIVWRHPEEFARAGLFSGSFWWRSRDKGDAGYDESMDRIMQRTVREGGYYPWLKFFFECGTEDEKEDRNGNGVIDSIDDTKDLIAELVAKGYDPAKDIRYLEIEGGDHTVETWARAMPEFLLWGWRK